MFAFATNPLILVTARGQSNMTDNSAVSALTQQQFVNPYQQVRELSMQGNPNDPNGPPILTSTPWQPLAPINWQGALRIGALQSCMIDLDRALPGAWVTDRYALYNTSLAFHWLPSGTYPSATAPPNLCALSISQTVAAKAAVGASRVVELWIQGENDALASGPADLYQTNLAAFINSVRASALGTDVPFVIVKLNADYTGGTVATRNTVRAAQEWVCANIPNCYLVDADSITIASGGYDGVHYTADGYVALGHLCSPAIALACGLVIPPLSSFVPEISLTDSLEVDFTDTTEAYGWAVTNWLWNFGDGNTSTLQSPSHTYVGAGAKVVTLTTTNSGGASNTLTMTINVGGIVGVWRDPQKGWYRPQTVAQWRILLDTSGHPEIPDPICVWTMQEASGATVIVDNAGLADLTVNTPSGTLYRQPMPGFSTLREIVQYEPLAGMSSGSASLPDLSANSVTVIAFETYPIGAPTTPRANLQIGVSPNSARIVTLANGAIQGQNGVFTVSGSVNMCDGDMHISSIVWKQTATIATAFYTEQERLVPTALPGTAGKLVAFGSFPAGSACLTGGGFAGAAEFAYPFSQTQMRDVYETLGPSVPW